MNGCVMLGYVVAIVFFARCPVMSKLVATFSVAEPMVVHVHPFQLFDDVTVDNAESCGVVHLYWLWRLGMTHGFESMSSGDGLSAVYVESFHLSLYCQRYDGLDYLCNCKDGIIVWWFSGVARHVKMSAHPAVCIQF
jgi:hypothetical protein